MIATPHATFIVGDVFDGLAAIPDGSVDLVLTSPPFLALRSYLPADHPDKGKEIGTESTPADFLDTLLALTAEFRRVITPGGSIVVELGDTYSGSGGAGGDYNKGGMRAGQPKADGSGRRSRAADVAAGILAPTKRPGPQARDNMDGWPMAKSLCGIPAMYQLSLAYGRNILTSAESKAGRWRVRNLIPWVRPNPPVGAVGDKFRPASSYLIVATLDVKRYFDLDAVRIPTSGYDRPNLKGKGSRPGGDVPGQKRNTSDHTSNPLGKPPSDWWEIPTKGFKGSHYAVWPERLLDRPIKAMCPAGGVVLDPFAGSGTTLKVATDLGRDAIGIDLDQRNARLAHRRVVGHVQVGSPFGTPRPFGATT